MSDRGSQTKTKVHVALATMMAVIGGTTMLGYRTVGGAELDGTAVQKPAAKITVVPKPAFLELGKGSFAIRPDTGLVLSKEADADEKFAARALAQGLEALHGLEVSTLAPEQAGAKGVVIIGRATEDPKFSALTRRVLAVDNSWLGKEGYTLEVTPDAVVVRAATGVGLYYACQTLVQMSRPPAGKEARVPGVFVKDRPRFGFRGYMLDPARTFPPFEYLKRTVDLMSHVKMNVFHLHLTDDQGWRIESKMFPELTERGSDGKFYTQEQMKELISYAAKRGVTIVPEFDMPGHTMALLAAKPELSCDGQKREISKSIGIFKGVICVGNEENFKFLDAFLDEMARLFPGEYVHIGGDEVRGTLWKKCPKCSALRPKLREKKLSTFTYFVGRVQELLAKHGKKMMGWEEITKYPQLDPNAIAHHWHWGTKGLTKLLRSGRPVVLSQLEKPGEVTKHRQHRLYLRARRGNQSAKLAYYYGLSPTPEGVTPQEAKVIRGLEACIWGRHSPVAGNDMATWPKLLAVCELAWSPERTRKDPVAEHTEFFARVRAIQGQLEKRWQIKGKKVVFDPAWLRQ